MLLENLNLTTDLPDQDLSQFIGSLRVTPFRAAAAYACLARQGIHVEPGCIRRVKQDGMILYERKPDARRVIKPSACREVTKGLRAVLMHGTAARHGGAKRTRAAP